MKKLLILIVILSVIISGVPTFALENEEVSQDSTSVDSIIEQINEALDQSKDSDTPSATGEEVISQTISLDVEASSSTLMSEKSIPQGIAEDPITKSFEEMLAPPETAEKIKALLNGVGIEEHMAAVANNAVDTISADLIEFAEYTSYHNQTITCYALVPNDYNWTTDNRKVFLNFGMHGWEDGWQRDAKALYLLAVDLVTYYHVTNPAALNKTMLFIVPCSNPDGTYYGLNNYRHDHPTYGDDAYGRCTAEHYDMNRENYTYNGLEADYLKTTINYADPNVFIDFHGWFSGYNYTSTGGSTEDSKAIGDIFLEKFNASKPSGDGYHRADAMYAGDYEGDITPHAFARDGMLDNDYLAGWAASTGIVSTLIELPAPTFDGNKILEIHNQLDFYGNPVYDPYTGELMKVIDYSASTFLSTRIRESLNGLFVSTDIY